MEGGGVILLTSLYCTVLYCTVLYCTVLKLYCTKMYCTVLCCTFLCKPDTPCSLATHTPPHTPPLTNSHTHPLPHTPTHSKDLKKISAIMKNLSTCFVCLLIKDMSEIFVSPFHCISPLAESVYKLRCQFVVCCLSLPC